jgi:hypothetical protein
MNVSKCWQYCFHSGVRFWALSFSIILSHLVASFTITRWWNTDLQTGSSPALLPSSKPHHTGLTARVTIPEIQKSKYLLSGLCFFVFPLFSITIHRSQIILKFYPPIFTFNLRLYCFVVSVSASHTKATLFHTFVWMLDFPFEVFVSSLSKHKVRTKQLYNFMLYNYTFSGNVS